MNKSVIARRHFRRYRTRFSLYQGNCRSVYPGSVLLYYQRAFDKILREIASEILSDFPSFY